MDKDGADRENAVHVKRSGESNRTRELLQDPDHHHSDASRCRFALAECLQFLRGTWKLGRRCVASYTGSTIASSGKL